MVGDEDYILQSVNVVEYLDDRQIKAAVKQAGF